MEEEGTGCMAGVRGGAHGGADVVSAGRAQMVCNGEGERRMGCERQRRGGTAA